MVGGCQIEDKTTDGKFGVGYAIGKTVTLRIANHDERFSDYDFYSSIINLYVAAQLDDGTIEMIRKGVYYTTVPQTPGDVIEISAVDSMYRLDRDYSESNTVYPATLQTIITISTHTPTQGVTAKPNNLLYPTQPKSIHLAQNQPTSQPSSLSPPSNLTHFSLFQSANPPHISCLLYNRTSVTKSVPHPQPDRAQRRFSLFCSYIDSPNNKTAGYPSSRR